VATGEWRVRRNVTQDATAIPVVTLRVVSPVDPSAGACLPTFVLVTFFEHTYRMAAWLSGYDVRLWLADFR